METVNRPTTVIINSSENSDSAAHYRIEGNTSLVVMIEGKKPLQLKLDVEVEPQAHFTFLLINHNEAEVNMSECFHLSEDSDSVIAYCQLNDQPLHCQSSYQLDGQGASLRVQNAALTAVNKYFSQNTVHNQPHTSADIFNYGIAMNSGYCDFDVRNRIRKGCKGCETHQTSRILTFDQQSKGRIMPVLYIDDNDVKASHAATMGQPDAEQIFYMQTRGLSRQDAMKLITIGYLMPISKVIDDADLNNLLKQEIETKVSQCLM